MRGCDVEEAAQRADDDRDQGVDRGGARGDGDEPGQPAVERVLEAPYGPSCPAHPALTDGVKARVGVRARVSVSVRVRATVRTGHEASRSRARVRGARVPAAHHAERSETPGASRERGAHRGVGRYPRRARQADVLNRAEVEPQPANREQEGAEGAERRGVAAQLVGRLVPRAEPAGSRPDDLGGKQGHDTFLARGQVSACVLALAGVGGRPRTSCQVNDAGTREVIGAAQDCVLVRPR